MIFKKRVNLDRVLQLSTVVLAMGLTACAPGQNIGSLSVSESDQGIVGGQVTDFTSPVAKHVVALIGVKGGSLYTCTGTLVTRNIVMTAAHCVTTGKMKVLFTKNVQATVVGQKTDLMRNVVAKAIHPKWTNAVTAQGDDGDLALIKFEGTLPLGYYPAQVSVTNTILGQAMPIYLIGFGVSNPETGDGSGILRHTESTILGARSTGLIIIEQRQGRGVCFGDSGGPSFVKVNNEYVVWGVASAVTANPQCREYGLYTNLAAYGDWIKQAASNLAMAQGL